MNYYPFHLGDYASHTGHLEPIEDLAYRRMLDAYYLREGALPKDPAEVARIVRMRQHVAEVEAVLKEFFRPDENGWSHERCEREISAMRDKQQKQRDKANKRWHKPESDIKDAVALPQHNHGNAHAMPPTPTPTPTPIIEEGTNVPVGKPDKLPRCDKQAIVDLYHEVLPELPKVRLMNSRREKAIAGMWKFVLTSKRADGQPRAQDEQQAMEWIRAYFTRARANDFLMGRGVKASGHEGWECDFDFLLSEKGKKQVIEKTREAAHG